jgi:hypothetical protein
MVIRLLSITIYQKLRGSRKSCVLFNRENVFEKVVRGVIHQQKSNPAYNRQITWDWQVALNFFSDGTNVKNYVFSPGDNT